MRTSFALVFNNRAGVPRPKLLDRVVSALEARGAHLQMVVASSAEEATARVRELAQAGQIDAVIAAGGDGTFRAVAMGAANTRLPVGFVPLGTGNVLAYELGIGKRAAPLADVLLHGAALRVRSGLVNGVPFFLMVGAGFDARIVNHLNYRTKRLLARAAYTGPLCRALARGAEMFDVEVDGRRYDASWIIVTRASHYGGSFTLTRQTQLGADPMIALLVAAQSRMALMRSAVALALGRFADPKFSPPGSTIVPAHRVVIGRRVATPIQVDGDQSAGSPVEVVADGPWVHVLVPPAYVADLTSRHTNHLDSLA
jgi:diacylglycerol kinase (ATP)